MGNVIFASCFGRKRHQRRIVLLLVGLDNAGKTKTANHLTGDSDREVLPTVGFKAVNLVHRNCPVTIYDLGGGAEFRGIWEEYYSDVHGVIFVVDSTDLARIEECKEVFRRLLSHERISGKPVLILANKQDMLGAIDDLDLVERMDIEVVVNKYRCPTRVESYAANSLTAKGSKRGGSIDPGLHKGYYWLLNYIIHRYGDLNLRVQTDMNHERTKRAAKEHGKPHEECPTSFENPNYKPPQTNGEVHGAQDGVIVVKEAAPAAAKNDVDYDAIEVVDENGDPDAVKLSPLFGKRNDRVPEQREPVELEARLNVRKLSPILRKRIGAEDASNGSARPHTSPSLDAVRRKAKLTTKGKDRSLDSVLTPPTSPGHMVEISLLGGDAEDNHKPWKTSSGGSRTQIAPLPPIGKSAPIRLTSSSMDPWPLSKSCQSDPNMIRTNMTPSSSSSTSTPAPRPSPSEKADLAASTGAGVRPHSASQAVRTQLEISRKPIRRKLSLKSLKRNRTSPETAPPSIFSYDPNVAKHSGDTETVGDFTSKTDNYGRVGLRSDTVM